jgi:hypothetical protein
MKNLGGFFGSEHGRAAQEPGGSLADRGGGPYSRSRQRDDERLGIHGCFDGPDDLIPGITLGALVCQLKE